jgi:hypothetical protein
MIKTGAASSIASFRPQAAEHPQTEKPFETIASSQQVSKGFSV